MVSFPFQLDRRFVEGLPIGAIEKDGLGIFPENPFCACRIWGKRGTKRVFLEKRATILALPSYPFLHRHRFRVDDFGFLGPFMTIPEASSLVLKAGGVGAGGEVYLLDMGEAVSIKELAEQMIRFYGYEPDSDVKLVYTGLRRGEKLLEKLHADTEVTESTGQPKILKLQRKTLINGRITSVLERLRPVCFHDPQSPASFRNKRCLRAILQEVIPGIELAPDEPEF